jgi:hypothetical protein
MFSQFEFSIQEFFICYFYRQKTLIPKVLGVFFLSNCFKTAPIQSKIDCAKSESLLVHLTVRSYS